MSLPIIAALAGLAFLDASTLSTLLVPLWLLARPGPFQPRRMITYFTITAITYLVLGAAVLLLANQLIGTYLATLQGPLADRFAMALGGVVILMGIIGLFRTRRETKPGPTMVTRLRDRALKSHGSVATLALIAILVEAATMWPYLVGISLIAANGPDGAKGLIWLAFYNVIMILPGTILTWARARYPQHTELLLTKTRETMTTAGSNFTAWLAIVIGAWLIIARLF